MISIQDMSAGYGAKVVLQNITLEVAAGDFLGLIGPNGSGKTTLLRTISGVLTPKRGQIMLRDTDLQHVGRRCLAKTMAFLPQDLALDFSFTVRDVVLMGRSPHMPRIGRETRNDLEIAERAMALTRVSHLADRVVTEISGGERQRALVAMCLAQEPELLLLDEPTNHLDVAHQLSILDLIRRLNLQSGMTVIGVFHDLNLAAEYCEKLVVLHRGRVEVAGSAEDVLTAEMILSTFQAKVMIERNPLSRKPHLVVSAGMNHSPE